MKALRMRPLVAMLALSFACGLAFAEGALSHGDRKFVEKAAEGGMSELQIGQLASTKASDPNVKSFASMLVDDHTKANNELVEIAKAKKLELPAAPPRAKRHELDKLGKKNGAEFDKEFIEHAGVKDHKSTIKLFEKAAKDAKDPDLKAFAQKTLPTLQKHLAEAEKLQVALKGNAASMGAHGSGSPMPAGPSGGIPTPKNKGS